MARREAGYYTVSWNLVDGESNNCGITSATRLTMEKYTGAPTSDQRDVAIRPTSFNGVAVDTNPGVATSDEPAVGTSSIAISPFTAAFPNTNVKNPQNADVPVCTTTDFPAATRYYTAAEDAAQDPPTTNAGKGASYTFSNVQFLEGASYLGSEMAADVEYTTTASTASGAATCTAHFHAVAIAPTATCYKFDPSGCLDPTGLPMKIDADGDPQYSYGPDANPITDPTDPDYCDADCEADACHLATTGFATDDDGFQPVPNPAYDGKSFQANLCDQVYVNAHLTTGDDTQVSLYYTNGVQLSNAIRTTYNLTCDGATPASTGYCIPAAAFPSLRSDVTEN